MTRSAAGTGARARLLYTLSFFTVLPAIALACTATHARAQDAADSVRDGWMVGGVIGVPGYRSEPAIEATTLGVVGTRLVPNRPGAEVALGIMPRAMADGFLAIGVRGGLAVPVALTEHAYLIPTAGVSGVGGAGSGGGGAFFGLHGGLSTVFVANRVGFRTGVTVHRFTGADEMFWLFEIGLVRVPPLLARVSR